MEEESIANYSRETVDVALLFVMHYHKYREKALECFFCEDQGVGMTSSSFGSSYFLYAVLEKKFTRQYFR